MTNQQKRLILLCAISVLANAFLYGVWANPGEVRSWTYETNSTIRGSLLTSQKGYATAEDDPSLHPSSPYFTLETWVKRDSLSDSNAVVVSKGDATSDGYILQFLGRGEEIRIQFINFYRGESLTSIRGIRAGEWTHVALIVDTYQTSFYIDGELDNQFEHQYPIRKSAKPLRIGTNSAASGEFLKGQIDEFRIWNGARSADEIRDGMLREIDTDSPDLLVYYQFDESGTTVEDVSSHENTLKVEGAASVVPQSFSPLPPVIFALPEDGATRLAWYPDPRYTDSYGQVKIYRSEDEHGGKQEMVAIMANNQSSFVDENLANGKAYFYTATLIDTEGNESEHSKYALSVPVKDSASYALTLKDRGYASVADRPSLNPPPRSLTIEAWVKRDTTSNTYATIITKGRDGHTGFVLRYHGIPGNVKVELINYNWQQQLRSKQSIPAGKWVHIAGVFKEYKMFLYINGELDSEGANKFPLLENNEPLRIGTNADAGGTFLTGQVDELRLWRVARTKEQIQYGKDHRLEGSEEGLLSYWRFDESDAIPIRSITNRPQLLQLTGDATLTPSGIWPEIQNPTSISDEEVPLSFSLHQNYPNPFNPSTTLRFDLSASSNVRLEVFDLLGHKMETLVDGPFSVGSHEVVFHADAFPSGIYVYRLQTDQLVETRFMTLTK